MQICLAFAGNTFEPALIPVGFAKDGSILARHRSCAQASAESEFASGGGRAILRYSLGARRQRVIRHSSHARDGTRDNQLPLGPCEASTVLAIAKTGGAILGPTDFIING